MENGLWEDICRAVTPLCGVFKINSIENQLGFKDKCKKIMDDKESPLSSEVGIKEVHSNNMFIIRSLNNTTTVPGPPAWPSQSRGK